MKAGLHGSHTFWYTHRRTAIRCHKKISHQWHKLLCNIYAFLHFRQHQDQSTQYTVYPKKYAHGFCFAMLCCGYTLTDFPISIRLTSLALWQSNDCPSASKATLMNMDKYFMWIHYERLHNHNKAMHNKTVCIFLGIYCISGLIVCALIRYNFHHSLDNSDRFYNGHYLMNQYQN